MKTHELKTIDPYFDMSEVKIIGKNQKYKPVFKN